jgi:maleylpyruvate isomerase
MTAPAPDILLPALPKAAGDVTTDVAKLTDADVKAPSALPGWSRGDVLAHLTGISNAMARQLEYAARGETVELYDGGMDGRNRAIDMAAGHGAATHQADLSTAIDRALRAFDALPGVKDSAANRTGWWAPIAYRGGVVLDGGLALWRELTIHNADLLTGRGPETWGRDFCGHLFEFLEPRVQPGDKLLLQPLGLPPVSLGSGNRSTVVNGMLTDLAAWLAGREPTLGSLRASANADGTDLPELLPWPSATQAAK